MGHLSKAGVLTVRLVQISRSILGEGCELKDYKTPRDVTMGKKETVAFDSSNVEKNESLKGTRNQTPPAIAHHHHHLASLSYRCWLLGHQIEWRRRRRRGSENEAAGVQCAVCSTRAPPGIEERGERDMLQVTLPFLNEHQQTRQEYMSQYIAILSPHSRHSGKIL